MNISRFIPVAKRGLQAALILFTLVSLNACVEINGKAEVSDTGRVKVQTQYDFSKALGNIQASNPALSSIVNDFNCKIFVSNSPNFKCKDEGVLKYTISDEADKPVGVTFNEATGELSFDAVKYFTQVTDLKSMVQRDGRADFLGDNIPPFLPLRSENRQRYQKEGLKIVLALQFANDIVSIDGQAVSDKRREVSINFIDIADKPNYVIVTKAKRGFAWGSWLFAILVMALLAMAVWFLWKRNQGGNPSPSFTSARPNTPHSPNSPDLAPSTTTSPATNSATAILPNATETEMDADASVIPPDYRAQQQKDSRAERIASALSAAAVGMGSTAVGGGANHTVEELKNQEEHRSHQSTEPSKSSAE